METSIAIDNGHVKSSAKIIRHRRAQWSGQVDGGGRISCPTEMTFLNADEIAKGLPAIHPRGGHRGRARILLWSQMDDLEAKTGRLCGGDHPGQSIAGASNRSTSRRGISSFGSPLRSFQTPELAVDASPVESSRVATTSRLRHDPAKVRAGLIVNFFEPVSSRSPTNGEVYDTSQPIAPANDRRGYEWAETDPG